MKRKIVMSVTVLVTAVAVLAVRPELTPHARAANKHVYRCLSDQSSMTLSLYNPAPRLIVFHVLVRDSVGATASTASGPLQARWTYTASLAGQEADITSAAPMFVTATAGIGDAVHTIRCS